MFGMVGYLVFGCDGTKVVLGWRGGECPMVGVGSVGRARAGRRCRGCSEGALVVAMLSGCASGRVGSRACLLGMGAAFTAGGNN